VVAKVEQITTIKNVLHFSPKRGSNPYQYLFPVVICTVELKANVLPPLSIIHGQSIHRIDWAPPFSQILE
jgi:hypothetical protein